MGHRGVVDAKDRFERLLEESTVEAQKERDEHEVQRLVQSLMGYQHDTLMFLEGHIEKVWELLVTAIAVRMNRVRRQVFDGTNLRVCALPMNDHLRTDLRWIGLLSVVARTMFTNRSPQDIVQGDRDLFERKQRDYGKGNIDSFGVAGVIVRMNDKVARLLNILGRGSGPAVTDESLEDTFADLSIYAMIAQMVADGEWEGAPSEPVSVRLDITLEPKQNPLGGKGRCPWTGVSERVAIPSPS